jgi:hypothetical protein
MQTRTHSFFLFLPLGFLGAFLIAFAFVATIYFTLPPTDEAYGRGLFHLLANPFVITIATPVAVVAGALAAPLLYFCLRRRKLSVALPFVFGSVLVAVAFITPWSQMLGLFSSIAALVVSCIACTQIRATSYEISDEPKS